MPSVLTADELIAAHDAVQSAVPIASTGFTELDALTGGMVPGRVWVVVSVPGEGRTTLLAQWAAAIASRPGQMVHLVTPREEPTKIVARLLSLAGLVPLHYLSIGGAVPASQRERFDKARDQVRGLALCLYAQGDDTYVPEVQPFVAAMKPTAVIIDDADLCGGVDPAFVSRCAEAGVFVLISLPRHLVMTSADAEADHEPAWARASDVIVEIRHRGVTRSEDRPGEADLDIRNNRWGYLRTIRTLYQGHYSRFVQGPG